MSNPPNDVELIQEFCRNYVNKIVRQHFSDLNDIDESNLTTTNSRHVAKMVSLHKDNDPITLTTTRLLCLFFAMSNWEGDPIYGLPATEFHETKEFLPQVVLWFREKTSEAKVRGSYPARARVSFRIMDENFTPTEARALAVKIKNIFATPPVKFQKGELKISYRDLKNGWEFILTPYSESEAREIITKTMELRNQVPDWELLSNTESGRNFKTKRTKTILGQSVTMPNRRPIANVYFSHAELKIHGLTRDKILVDTTGRYPDAYEYVF
ncbi:hypothetical protein H6G27_09910 [Nostoc linckia FACHB-104]|nr:hypothetical protein [Nostoc linckia FACHB-104]